MPITWKELKIKIEALGVTDEDLITDIDIADPSTELRIQYDNADASIVSVNGKKPIFIFGATE